MYKSINYFSQLNLLQHTEITYNDVMEDFANNKSLIIYNPIIAITYHNKVTKLQRVNAFRLLTIEKSTKIF